MLAEKGFWVGIILLLATTVTAIEFEWTVTQDLSGNIPDKFCAVTLDRVLGQRDHIYAAQAFTESKVIFELPYEYPITAYSSNAHYGHNRHAVISGIGLYDTEGNLIDFAYGFSEYTKNLWIDSRKINGTGKIIRACAGCGRGYCDTSAGAYHILLSSPPKKDNITRSEGKKLLGAAKELAKPQYYENWQYLQILADTTSPIVHMLVDTDKNVYACIDTDKDKTCDYEQAQACENQGGDWNAVWPGKTQSLCCGVTHTPAGDCQYYSDLSSICGKNAEGKYKWAAAGLEGQARALSCPTPVSFLADGQELYACGNPAGLGTFKTFTKKKIKENDFICVGTTIHECGKASMAEDNEFKEGGELVDANGEINFCSPSGNWITELDADKDACIAVAKKKTWDVAWTGSKCCGDPEDTDSYEDEWKGEGEKGGCYKNKAVRTGEFTDEEHKIINHNGKFYACDSALAEGTKDTTILPDTTLTIAAQGPCGRPLENATLTGILPHAICMPSGTWSFTNTTATTFIKKTAWKTDRQSEGCCPEDQCWDGTICRKTGEYYSMGEEGFRCQ